VVPVADDRFAEELQSTMLLGDSGGILVTTGRARPVMAKHQEMESYLGRYAGLVIYLKEMDESIYAKLCAVRITQHVQNNTIDDHTQAYFSAASELHSTQMKKMFSMYANLIKKVSEDTQESSLWYCSASRSISPHSP
jgi:exocyst complex component 1